MTLSFTVPGLAQILATLSVIGVPTWFALIGADTLIGMVVRSGNNGKFSLAYVKNFITANFATKEFVAMVGLAAGAVASALTAHIAAGDTGVASLLNVVANTAEAAFVATVAAQDTSLLHDIVLKLTGQSTGQIARKATVSHTV